MEKRFKNSNKPIVSVVVSTYNRVDLLERCMQSLQEQNANRKVYEVLIIDNNSKDSTKSAVRKYTDKVKNFRYFKEKKQGLSHAKNRGWKESRGEYVAYIDDDAISSKDWVKEIIDFIKRYPKIVAFGGPYFGYTNGKKPKWLPPKYGNFSLGDRERPIKTPYESLSGSNTVFKKKVLKRQGGFKTDLGMKGDKLLYGEETKLIFDLVENRHEVYYSPNIKVRHLISKKKYSVIWHFKNGYIRGYQWSIIHSKEYLFRQHINRILKSLKNVKWLISLKPIPYKRKIYYAFLNFFSKLGSFVYFLNSKH